MRVGSFLARTKSTRPIPEGVHAFLNISLHEAGPHVYEAAGTIKDCHQERISRSIVMQGDRARLSTDRAPVLGIGLPPADFSHMSSRMNRTMRGQPIHNSNAQLQTRCCGQGIARKNPRVMVLFREQHGDREVLWHAPSAHWRLLFRLALPAIPRNAPRGGRIADGASGTPSRISRPPASVH
jgi:hypothetical protein